MESVVFVKKSQIYDEDNLSSPYEHVDSHSNESLPEIEVRVYDQNILIRIHCKKQKGLLVKTLAEIEKFQLSVINTNVMPFSSSALDITVIAQVSLNTRILLLFSGITSLESLDSLWLYAFSHM